MFAPEPSIDNQVQDVEKVDKASVEKLGEYSENIVGDKIASKPSEGKAQMEDPNPKEESMPCSSSCPNFSSAGTLNWQTTPALLDGQVTLKTWLTQTRHRWSNTKWATDAFKEEAHLQSLKNWNPSRPTAQITEVIRGLIRAVIKFHSEEKRPHGYLFNLENILLGDSKVKYFPNAAMKIRKVVLYHHNMEEKQEDMHECLPGRKAMYDEKSIDHDMEVLARDVISHHILEDKKLSADWEDLIREMMIPYSETKYNYLKVHPATWQWITRFNFYGAIWHILEDHKIKFVQVFTQLGIHEYRWHDDIPPNTPVGRQFESDRLDCENNAFGLIQHLRSRHNHWIEAEDLIDLQKGIHQRQNCHIKDHDVVEYTDFKFIEIISSECHPGFLEAAYKALLQVS